MEKFGIKTILSFLGTTFFFLFGGWDIALQSMVVMIVIDYITGVSRAFIKKDLNSEIGFKGIIKKTLMFAIVAVAVVVDKATGETGLVRNLVIWFLVANEGISILENLAAMDIIIPDFLKEKLEQIKGSNKKEVKKHE